MVEHWKSKGYNVVVHPECRKVTVDVADGAGSTAFLWDHVMNDRAGTKKYAVGTENHMVDNLKWAGEEIIDENSKITAMSQMGMWNAKTNKEAVLGYSIKHAWGALELTKSKPGMKLAANVKLDIDLESGETGFAEALHIKVGSALESLEELITVTGNEVDASTDGESFGGWCSWYGFNPFIDNDITEDVVVNFAKTAEEKRNIS